MLENEHDRGMICAVSAFLLWGFLPIYWKTLAPTTALEVIAHRIVWSFVFTWVILLWQPPADGWRSILQQRQRLIGLLFSALLLVGNWLSYVVAVQQDRVLEVSLGYFIVPLLNILFGFLFLRERFSSWQWLAIGLTALALINLMRQAEQFPWLGLIIALTFAGYGFMRKVIQVQGMLGLWMEMVILMPLSFILLWYMAQSDGLYFGSSWDLSLLLATTGVITSLPLLLFAAGARRLPLATLGLLQFIAPTCFFILGIFLYEEPFSQIQAISFGLIWIAVVIYLSQIQRQTRLLQENKAQTVHRESV